MPRRGVAVQRYQAASRRRPRVTPKFRRNPAYHAGTVFTGTVTNAGTVSSSPVISIVGALTASTVFFENITAGSTVWITVAVGAGQTLSVDFSTRVVTLAGVVQSGVVSVDSRWWDLAVGANLLRSNVAATVTSRDAFA